MRIWKAGECCRKLNPRQCKMLISCQNVIRCNNVRPADVALGRNQASSTVVSLELFRTPASTTTTIVPLGSCSRKSRPTNTTGRHLRDTKSSYRPSPTEEKRIWFRIKRQKTKSVTKSFLKLIQPVRSTLNSFSYSSSMKQWIQTN